MSWFTIASSAGHCWPVRIAASRVIGVGGLVCYNWWVGALVHGGVISSPNELFSDLEAAGGSFAVLFSRLDVAAGVLVLIALALRGRWGTTGVRREWSLLLLFAFAGACGGFFPYSCPEGVNAVCRTAEWQLQLPWRQYVHVGAGIVEFGSATAAIFMARRRTVNQAVLGGIIRRIVAVLLVAYPLLGVAYLTDHLGAFVEPVFFVCFSLMVAIELFEPAGDSRASPISAPVTRSRATSAPARRNRGASREARRTERGSPR